MSVVNTAFNQVRPVVESQRLSFLKKEILRIAKAAKEDGAGAQGLIGKFQYEDTEKQYKDRKDNCIEELTEKLDTLQSSLSSIKNKYNFSERDIFSVKETVRNCETVICEQMKSLNSAIISACGKLNIDSRNIITDFRFDKPELNLEKKTEVVKNGYWKKGKRHWYTLWLRKDDDVWVDTSYTHEVTDVSASIQNAINYINISVKVFRQTIQRWQKSLEITEKKLYSEIQNRRSEYEARINKALDCQAYQKIGIELERIAESIKLINETQTKVNTTRTDVKQSQVFSISVDTFLLPMYKLSESIRIRVHNDTNRFFRGNMKQHCIVGWDEYCETKFLRYAFNLSITENSIVKGRNKLRDSITLIHKPKSSAQDLMGDYKGVYVLVNATQIGAAMNEISRFKVKNLLSRNDELFFVIQDFNEVMNGDSVSETLDNVIGIKRSLGIGNTKVRYLLLHDNPIYNLAATEAQTVGCTTQFDEIKILNDLQKKFGYLLPQIKTKRNIVESTIRIIIQKLGIV